MLRPDGQWVYYVSAQFAFKLFLFSVEVTHALKKKRTEHKYFGYDITKLK